MNHKIGLIGDQIAGSLSPLLHSSAAEVCGIELDYQLLIPAIEGLDFDGLYRQCKESGYHGLNITYPYKERIPDSLDIDDTLVSAIGAINTLVFRGDRVCGTNTDYSGFVNAYGFCFEDQAPGSVTVFGAGGVGKAVAFGLLKLGVRELRLVDSNPEQASALARVLQAAQPEINCEVFAPEDVIPPSDGLINCTPVGMQRIPGCAVPDYLMGHARWCFDAVYDPVDTEFLLRAQARGIAVMSGIDLFVFMGLDTFHFFTGSQMDMHALVRAMQSRLRAQVPPDHRTEIFNRYNKG